MHAFSVPWPAGRQRGGDIGDTPADRQVRRESAFEPEKNGEHVCGRGLGRIERQKGRQRHVVAGPFQCFVELCHHHGGRKGCEQPSREAACPGSREIEVAATVALREKRLGRMLLVQGEPEQRIVMAVEDRDQRSVSHVCRAGSSKANHFACVIPVLNRAAFSANRAEGIVTDANAVALDGVHRPAPTLASCSNAGPARKPSWPPIARTTGRTTERGSPPSKAARVGQRGLFTPTTTASARWLHALSSAENQDGRRKRPVT